MLTIWKIIEIMMTACADDRSFRLPLRIADRTMEGETVIVNLDNGLYFTLNETASSIWNLIISGKSLASTVEALAVEYTVDPEHLTRSVERACNEWLQAGLIELKEEGE